MIRRNIEIPIGVSDQKEEIVLSLPAYERNHCLITGSTGAGKTTLLKTIMESAVRRYDPSEVIIRTNVDELDDIKADGIFELIDQLHDEVYSRWVKLHKEKVSTYAESDVPLVLAVIEDLFYFCRSGEDDKRILEALGKTERILHMSHVVGLSLICTCRMLSLERFYLLFPRISELFNIRIFMGEYCEDVYENLGIGPSELSAAGIDLAKRRHTGDFIIHNRHQTDSLQAGHVFYTI